MACLARGPPDALQAVRRGKSEGNGVRTCGLSDLLGQRNAPGHGDVVRRRSPSVPTLYEKVLERDGLRKRHRWTRLPAIVSKDIGMVAKILHVVNSSFLRLRREITSPRQAVTLLGLETMRGADPGRRHFLQRQHGRPPTPFADVLAGAQLTRPVLWPGRLPRRRDRVRVEVEYAAHGRAVARCGQAGAASTVGRMDIRAFSSRLEVQATALGDRAG